MFKVFNNADTGEHFAINSSKVLDVFEVVDGDKRATVICAENGEKWFINDSFNNVVNTLNS